MSRNLRVALPRGEEEEKKEEEENDDDDGDDNVYCVYREIYVIS